MSRPINLRKREKKRCREQGNGSLLFFSLLREDHKRNNRGERERSYFLVALMTPPHQRQLSPIDHLKRRERSDRGIADSLALHAKCQSEKKKQCRKRKKKRRADGSLSTFILDRPTRGQGIDRL